VGQTRQLLPDVTLPSPPPTPAVVRTSPEEAERSLREVRRGVTSGLEPVTTSARRAVSLLLREVPAPRSGS
jgi:hypothetical protein